MPRTFHHVATCALASLCSVSVPAQRPAPLDIVIVGGRVIDPGTKLDAVRTVGVRGGKIVFVGNTTPAARDTVNAKGLVVSPGFIDLHSHGQDDANYGYLARDGVTTALELELGTYPVAPWYAEREGKARINYGTAVSHPGARRALLEHDSSRAGSAVISVDGPWARERLAEVQFPALADRLSAGLRDGALGVGMGLAYTPVASRAEVLSAFRVAAREKVPVYVHVRSGGPGDEDGPASVQEVLADAYATGASLHVVHITSVGAGSTPVLLDMIEGARAAGHDVSTEAYPYNAGATSITAAIFDPGFQQRLGIDYKDLLMPATGERLNAESFAKYRKSGGRVILFSIPDSVPERAYRRPFVMVASDGGLSLQDGKLIGHPRSSGTHARILGTFVRERRVLSLPDAIARMTLMPAQRLEGADPRMKQKGRVQVGADADLTLFDAARVTDRSTYENGAQYSDGIPHVLVNGTFVVRDGKLVERVRPGRAVRRGPSPR
jgi:cytosine/adenosine deaminase-related metal-dependent hydrolase